MIKITLYNALFAIYKTAQSTYSILDIRKSNLSIGKINATARGHEYTIPASSCNQTVTTVIQSKDGLFTNISIAYRIEMKCANDVSGTEFRTTHQFEKINVLEGLGVDVYTGSSFLISTSGYLITNCHVVDGAKDVMVKSSSGKMIPVTIIAKDKERDLALLRIDIKKLNLDGYILIKIDYNQKKCRH